jgi:PPOX class probable F420-dependent enzyme
VKKLINDIHLKAIIDKARVARLATVDSEGKPHLVPVVFAYDEEHYYIPIDEKTKQRPSKPEKLKRVKNIQANPNIALLIDEYNEDWTKLYFVMIQGRASLISNKKGEQENELLLLLEKAHKLLSEKYYHYQKIGIGEYVIIIYPQKIVTWKNEGYDD